MKFFCAYHNTSPRMDLLERLGLSEKRKAQFYELSTGQQRRLALALAVAHDPPVLFLDEPTAGLDVATRVELHDMMRELQKKGTTGAGLTKISVRTQSSCLNGNHTVFPAITQHHVNDEYSTERIHSPLLIRVSV